MADTSMPPPKQGGSGAFIGAAVAMLVAMGGLLYWKFGTEEEKPPPEPPPSATVEEGPVFEKPPPPPPPPEPEDAGKEEEEKPKKKATARKGRGGCSSPCTGGAPAALQRALSGKAGQARGCYERALRTNATLKGRLVVAVRVSRYGSVCSASIASNSLGDPSVSACVAQKFRGATLPKPKGGCVDVQVPISFKPKTQ